MVYLADALIIAVTVVALLWTFSYAEPLVISPVDELETSNNTVLFTFERGEAILLDDNPDFSSPERIYVEENEVISLRPGKHYWKVEGVLDSAVRELTIISKIDLRVRGVNDKMLEVINAGNNELNVEVYSNGSKVNSFTLGVGKNETSLGDKIIGGSNEK